MASAKQTWGKRVGIAAIIFTFLGLPWAGLIWLAGGMSSVPQLSLHDVAIASPPLLLAFILAAISFSLLRTDADARPMRRNMMIVMIVTVLVTTHYDTNEPRFLKPGQY